MFVIKLTDLIPEMNRSTGDFSRTNAIIMGFGISNKNSSGEDHLKMLK